MASANVWSGGSFVIASSQLLNVNRTHLEFTVEIERRKQGKSTSTVVVEVNADPIPEKKRAVSSLLAQVVDDPSRRPIDDLLRRLSRLFIMVGHAKDTGKLLQLAFQLDGSTISRLPENLFLNQVPHNPYVRQYFYDLAAQAVVDAVTIVRQRGNDEKQQQQQQQPVTTSRLQVLCQFPEMNPSMDSYRIGTLLEMVRTIAIQLATQKQETPLRVRICVQSSMGVGIFTGLPKQLNGVRRLFEMMDWQANEGEYNEGMLGTFVNFGAVGKEHVVNEVRDEITGEIVQHQDDVFLVIAPQSMVGTDSSITPLLQEMVEAAGSSRPVILFNPDLIDKPSSAGQQSVRGRQQRIDFANSFETIFCFQNIYISGTSYFPILGAVTKVHPNEPWVAHQRREYTADEAGDKGEIYVPVITGETRPTGDIILDAFER